MSNSTTPRKRAPRAPAQERRAAAPADGSVDPMRKLKSVLARPLAVQRDGGLPKLVLVERRRASPTEPWLPLLRSELQARLQAQNLDNLAHVMRHLIFVHDTLQAAGWRRVAALPSRVLAKAIEQAEMLSAGTVATQLERFVTRLHTLQRETAQREERAARGPNGAAAKPHLEVSEATHEEFAELERVWAGSLPAESLPPENPDPAQS